MDTLPTSPNPKPERPSAWNESLYSLLPDAKMPRTPQTFAQKVAFKLADVKAPVYPMMFMLFAVHVFAISYIFSDDFLTTEEGDDEDMSSTAKNLIYYAGRTRAKFDEIKSKFSAFIPGNTSTNSAKFERIKEEFSGSKSW